MARSSYITALLAGLPVEHRRALKSAFDYILDNMRFGRPEDSERAENGQQYYFVAATAPVANQEFEIKHGLASPPYLLIPVLPLDMADNEFVPLRVTRPADAERIYLSSPAVNALIRVLVEA
jgi:hypothetical protein